ncbi:DUF4199 domain-containing protein [Aquimarina sp. 2201CG5-10]|uniref:DUF4199 domain-containing protein n=1 Tax=Aquimarina callyspongiae TaxID=3098150 RepID=UPI002AB4D6E1|nr:DUF4199 domain-containing protein [Aquimarina sp. 2201CG5-10]MDY8137231.1 DUF4199 domain-containing protein [Aquimarina sp. 2201CG5-10]
MEKTTISTKKCILKYGVILGIVLIIYDIILYITGNSINKNWIKPIIELTILTSIIIYGIYVFKSRNQGFLKLGQALKIGIGIALIGGLVPFIWNFLLLNVIDPDLPNQILQAKPERLLSSDSKISQEQMDKSIEITKTFSSSYMLTVFLTVSNLFFGSLISLFAGAIMQRKKDVF